MTARRSSDSFSKAEKIENNENQKSYAIELLLKSKNEYSNKTIAHKIKTEANRVNLFQSWISIS